MGLYPDVMPAVPSSSVTPSRTERILRPSIVLTTVMLLAAMSLIAVIVAWSIFSSHEPHTSSICATQVFGLASATISVAYIFFHSLAAIFNDPVGLVRPPQYTLHAICFIVARLALVSWMLTFVTTLAVISQPTACFAGSRSCRLQVADVVASNLGFISAGTILTALEACRYPFQAPNALRKKAAGYGTSIYLLDQPVSLNSSQTSSMHCDYASQKAGVKTSDSSTIQKPLAHKSLSRGVDVPAPERPLTPLLPIARQPRPRGWGEEWTHPLKEVSPKRKKEVSPQGSGISVSSNSSSDLSSPSSNSSPLRRSSVSKRAVLSRNVTPSSSISSISRRSPLATMRQIRRASRHRSPATSEILPLHNFPTARVEHHKKRKRALSPRRHSLTHLPDQLPNRGPNKELPPLPRKPVPVRHSISKRSTTEIKVPGAYVDYRPSLDHERNIEEHLRKIETEHVTKTPSKRNQLRISSGRIEKSYAPTRVDSKSRYRERRQSVVLRASTKELEQVRSLQRLSLGNLSPGLGKVPYLIE